MSTNDQEFLYIITIIDNSDSDIAPTVSLYPGWLNIQIISNKLTIKLPCV